MISSSNGNRTQVIALKDIQDPEHLSLGSALRLGHAHIWLMDESGDRHSYQSISYKQNNLAENQVDITYQLLGGNI